MDLAFLAATRSTCLRRQVGCIAVKDNHVLATGYNGPPTGEPHCTTCVRQTLPSGDSLQICRAVHAEQNVIIQAATSGTNISGCTFYCTDQPCPICLKMLANCKPEKIVYARSYPSNQEVGGVTMVKFCKEGNI